MTDDVAQEVEVLATKPEGLSVIPRTSMIEG